MKSPLAPFPGSPPALGPYSLAVAASGKFLFVSGMTPYDPATGKIGSGSISQQTQLVLENVKAFSLREVHRLAMSSAAESTCRV